MLTICKFEIHLLLYYSATEVTIKQQPIPVYHTIKVGAAYPNLT